MISYFIFLGLRHPSDSMAGPLFRLQLILLAFGLSVEVLQSFLQLARFDVSPGPFDTKNEPVRGHHIHESSANCIAGPGRLSWLSSTTGQAGGTGHTNPSTVVRALEPDEIYPEGRQHAQPRFPGRYVPHPQRTAQTRRKRNGNFQTEYRDGSTRRRRFRLTVQKF